MNRQTDSRERRDLLSVVWGSFFPKGGVECAAAESDPIGPRLEERRRLRCHLNLGPFWRAATEQQGDFLRAADLTEP